MNRDLVRAIHYIFEGIGVVFLVMWLIFVYDTAVHFPDLSHPTPELFIEMFSDFRFIGLIVCLAMSTVFSYLKLLAEKQTQPPLSKPPVATSPQITNDYVYCIECGFKNIAMAKFCKQCGAKIE